MLSHPNYSTPPKSSNICENWEDSSAVASRSTDSEEEASGSEGFGWKMDTKTQKLGEFHEIDGKTIWKTQNWENLNIPAFSTAFSIDSENLWNMPRLRIHGKCHGKISKMPFGQIWDVFFPRASERRVLLIVGVCETSSHLHIFSSSHLLIFTYLPIFPSSHLHILTSSHLYILKSSHLFTSSHSLLPSCSLALLLPPSFLFLSWRRDATKCNPFARNEVRSPKTEVKLRFPGSRRNPFARNEVRSSKTEEKLRCHGFGLCVWKCLCVKASVCESFCL